MIKFGPSGNSLNFTLAGYKSSLDSAKFVKDLGLNAFEYSFGRGVNLSDETALEIGKVFKENGVEISVPAPYYINFANPLSEAETKGVNYMLSSAKKCKLMGGKRIIFHPASQGKEDRETTVNRTVERVKRLTESIYENGLDDMIYCPETMGKLAQIGTIEEIAMFCKIDKVFIPCVDFGHVNARENGSLKSYKDYKDRLEFLISELGYEKMKNFHIHFSHIEYSQKGEVRHLTNEDLVFGPHFLPLAEALIDLRLEPTVISESAGTQDIDAVEMKNQYYSLINK